MNSQYVICKQWAGSRIFPALLVAALLVMVEGVFAGNITWVGNGDRIWTEPDSDADWNPAYTSGTNVIFDDSASSTTVANGGAVTPGSVIFTNDAKNYTVSAIIAGTGSVTKAGSGTLTLNNTNTFSGGLNILNGTVAVGVALATNWLGTGTITLGDSSGTNSASLYASVAGAGDLFSNSLVVAAGSSGTLSISAANAFLTFTGPLALNNNLTLNLGNIGKSASFSGVTTETSVNSPALTVTVTNGFAVFSGGVVVGNGGLTFANKSTVTSTVGPGNITGTGPLIFKANSSGAFTVSAGIINNSGSITNSGAGTGGTTISGSIGSNVVNVVQNNPASQLTLSASNSFTGGLYINAGAVSDGGVAGALGPSGSTIYLGDTSGTNNATLIAGGNAGPIDSSNPIIVRAGSSGTMTIDQPSGNNNNGGYAGAITLNNNLTLTDSTSWGKSLTISGNISGIGNITLNPGPYLDASHTGGSVKLTSVSINNTGLIINSGAGTGVNTNIISGNIGSNVTAVVQSSLSSTLALSGTNTYSGPTIISNGLLMVSNVVSLPTNSALMMMSNAVVNLNGHTQTVLSVGGFGQVSNGWLNVSSAIYPGGSNGIGALTFTNLTLAEGSTIYWDYAAGTNDVIQVLDIANLPTNATVRVTGSGTPVSPAVLFLSGTNSAPGGVAGWTVVGLEGRSPHVVQQGNMVQLLTSEAGTVLMIE